jgi:cytosine/adenosine deaminase-related metal-dependent hydrolase
MADTAGPWTLTARCVFPADRPPLPRGTITIQGDKIIAVESAGTRAADEDLGNVAILPGLVNAHTHLDLSDARGKIPPTPDFTAWLRGVIQHRRGQTPMQVQKTLAAGLTELLRNGVTALGDVSVGGVSWDLLSAGKLRVLVFHEVIGLTVSRVREAVSAAVNWLERRNAELKLRYGWRIGKPWIADPHADCRTGLSPHAPYSFRSNELPLVSGWGQRITIHLAESRAECELLERHAGPFVPFLAELGVWDPSGLARSPRHVIELTSNAASVLFVHCNHLQPDMPIPNNGTIVYCPRTHAAFGHPPHPFREFLKRGVRVVLGTDSLASNPDLDILAEARFVAARHTDLPGETLLRMITLDSAIALGWGDVAGSLTPGKSADLVVLPLPDREEANSHRLLFDSESRVRRVLFRGEWTL